MKEIELYVKRSRRKTLAIEINSKCEVIVRAPLRMPASEIRNFVNDRHDWIVVHVNKMEKRRRAYEEHLSAIGADVKFTKDEMEQMRRQARKILTEKAEYYAKIMGLTYNRIAIKSQKTRWGSCSTKGNLNFNMLLVLCPDTVQDYVVVHELCHLMEMNHSTRFWAQVEKVMPDYRRQKKWLKEHGETLILRLP